MTQLPSYFLKTIGFDIENPRDQLLVNQSVMEHTRNGRGFWPVVTVDGIPQVVRFSVDRPGSGTRTGLGTEMHSAHPNNNCRWTPETGSIDLVPLDALPVMDWPHVRLAS